jgi:hypothetical protein
MPSHLKNLVRSRMAKTGESYQAALRHVRAGAPSPIPSEPKMYEAEARIIIADLEALVPGRVSATKGPGPFVTVRYYVGGTALVFNIILMPNKNEIGANVTTEPMGGIVGFSTSEPLTEEGARRTASRLIGWLSTQIDIQAVEAEFNAFPATSLLLALHQVGSHPLRGEEKSFDAVTDSGGVRDGQPVAGCLIRGDRDAFRFRVTTVTGDVYSWDEVAMKATSFAGFVHAMRDLLAGRSGGVERSSPVIFHVPRNGRASLTGYFLADAQPAGAGPALPRFVRAFLAESPTEEERENIRLQAAAQWPGRGLHVELLIRRA